MFFGAKPDQLRNWISIERSTAQAKFRAYQMGIDSAQRLLDSCAEQGDISQAILRFANYTTLRMAARAAQVYINHLDELRMHADFLTKSCLLPVSVDESLRYAYAMFEINNQKSFKKAIRACQSKHSYRQKVTLPREAEFYASKQTPTAEDVASEMKRIVDEGLLPVEFVSAGLATDMEYADHWDVAGIPRVPLDPLGNLPPDSGTEQTRFWVRDPSGTAIHYRPKGPRTAPSGSRGGQPLGKPHG
jgi:hypothetical protein